MKNQNATPDAPAPEPLATYEVICHSVEIGHLLCYRSHRLQLTRSQAEALNTGQPETVRFCGI